MEIQKVGVLGFGLMGSGIAQVCAQAGIETIAREVDQTFLDSGFARVEKNLSKAVEKNKISTSDKQNTPEVQQPIDSSLSSKADPRP